MTFNIKTAFTKAIEATDNPMAPTILQQAYAANEALGKLLVPIGDQAEIKQYMERLLKDFPEGDDSFVTKPSYIICLAGMLLQALITYDKELGR